jgi:hypothetical protein
MREPGKSPESYRTENQSDCTVHQNVESIVPFQEISQPNAVNPKMILCVDENNFIHAVVEHVHTLKQHTL